MLSSPLRHLQHLNSNPNPQIDLPTYDQWAAAQARTEIARAGYRLAAILKKIWPQSKSIVSDYTETTPEQFKTILQLHQLE